MAGVRLSVCLRRGTSTDTTDTTTPGPLHLFLCHSPVVSGVMAESGSVTEFSGSLPNSSLPPPRTRIFKIIVIGDSGVGKTCLTYRFCAGKFPEKTEATIGVDFRERLVDIDGENIKVRVSIRGTRTFSGRPR